MYEPSAALPSPGPGPEVAPAARGRRLAAWGLDAALLVVVAVLLGMMTWGRLNSLLADGLWGRALSATGGLLLTGGDVGQAAEDFGTSIWRDIVAAIEQALLLLVLIELLYRFAAERFTGRTLGKAALDLRVENATSGKPRAFRRAVVTTAGGTGLYSAAWILILHGLFFLALLTWLAAVVVFLGNSLPAIAGARRRTLADLLAGSAVVPAGGYRRAAEAARQGAGAAWSGTQAAGQAAGQAIRGNAARLAHDDRMRRALESEQARQVKDLGRQSAAKVRGAMDGEPARRAQDAGRRLGGRLRSAYSDRSASSDRGAAGPRAQAPAPPEPPALPPPEPHYDPYTRPEAQQWWPPAEPPPRENR